MRADRLVGTGVMTFLLLAALFEAGLAANPPARPAVPAETVILDDNSVWHCWLGWRTVQIADESGKLATICGRKNEHRPLSASEPPPAEWFATAFDDSIWARSSGPFGINAWSQSYVDTIGPGNPGEVAMICLRGKFRVDDPAAVGDLKLQLGFHGGAIVYLNGKEMTRRHLPADGPVNFDTPAERYGDEAYLRPDGKLLTERDAKEFPEPYAKRVRRLELAIPAGRLIKGVNVIAVAVCRSPTSQTYVTAPGLAARWPGPTTPWPHARVVDVKLSAEAGVVGVQSATRRWPGVRVWNRSVLEPTDLTDFDDPCDTLGPVRIAGCRNGSFNGQVVVSSDQPIGNLSASMSELRHTSGRGTIAASVCQVRYALPDGLPYQWYNYPPLLFDTLVDSPPNPVAISDKRGGAACPVWLTVRVPADASPGEYAGTLTVSADGLAATPVPVRLSVAPLVLPAAAQFRPHVGLIQSPDSVAMQYKVEMWSPRHWELLDRTFELLGQVGNKTVYLPLLRETHFGNEDSMLRWIRNADGTWSHDFSIIEKYLDLAAKHLGKPQVVCLYLWERYTGQTYLDTGKGGSPAKGLLITVIDPKTGQLSQAEGPKWDDPKIVEFLKPVIDGIRERLANRGMQDSMMLGMSGDMRPQKVTAEVLKQAAPGVKWINQAHPILRDLYGIPAGYITNVWNSGAPADPGIKPVRYKPQPFIMATFPRAGSKCIGPMYPYSSPVMPRLINEATIAAGMDGFGRVGADFWGVIPSKNPAYGGSTIIARYPHSGWAQLGINHATVYMLGPGPSRPESTVRLELLREGVQSAEARIQIDLALGDPAARQKLGDELAGRCDALLAARVYAILRSGASGMAGGARRNPYWWSFVSLPWQERELELFRLADEVSRAAGGSK